jgi:hypothetical protein
LTFAHHALVDLSDGVTFTLVTRLLAIKTQETKHSLRALMAQPCGPEWPLSFCIHSNPPAREHRALTPN